MQRLGDLTSSDVGPGKVLVVPVGSCEQHGPHLPLDTDTRIAVAVAEGAAARCDGAVVAPPLAIGASGEHAGFAGTLSIGTEVLGSVLVELARSADHFAGVFLLDAHGGNAEAVASAVRVGRAEGRAVVAHRVEFPGGDAHAGRTETSLMLALAPEHVHLGRADPGCTEAVSELMDDLRATGVAGVSPNGVLGDPTGASAAEGERLMEDAVAAASEALLLFAAEGCA